MKLQAQTRNVLFPNPDNQLMARIKRVLRRSGYAPLTQIRVVAEQGNVCLEGEVPTYFLKQMAQSQILSLEGVRSLKNALVVEARFNHQF
ncbi:MAG: BON domain-containing protein [Planctomycetota bacterium]